MEIPITSWPASTKSAAATEESTPPDIATTTRSRITTYSPETSPSETSPPKGNLTPPLRAAAATSPLALQGEGGAEHQVSPSASGLTRSPSPFRERGAQPKRQHAGG